MGALLGEELKLIFQFNSALHELELPLGHPLALRSKNKLGQLAARVGHGGPLRRPTESSVGSVETKEIRAPDSIANTTLENEAQQRYSPAVLQISADATMRSSRFDSSRGPD